MSVSEFPRVHAPRSRLTTAIVVIDAFLILFPPLHWWLAEGDLALALGYAIGVPVLIALSLIVLERSASRAADDAGPGERE